jgi:hypothetical protein
MDWIVPFVQCRGDMTTFDCRKETNDEICHDSACSANRKFQNQFLANVTFSNEAGRLK